MNEIEDKLPRIIDQGSKKMSFELFSSFIAEASLAPADPAP